MRDLTTLTATELEEFFGSFDHVFSDVDGVLKNFLEGIPGSADAIRSLRKIGKKIILVSNNTVTPIEALFARLSNYGFDLEIDDIVTPNLATVAYLKKHGLGDKEIFVIGSPALKDRLVEAGFTIAENGPDRIEETVHAFAEQAVIDDGRVGCVIADMDINLNYLNLQKAATFLERPEVLFLMGGDDEEFPVDDDRNLLGPGHFHKILQNVTGRTPIKMAKPSPLLNDYITEKYEVKDPSKVLFVGDSIPQDMGFGANCNFKTLLVFTGLAEKEELENWEFPEEFKPDFYVDSLGVLNDLLTETLGTKL